MAHIIYSFSYSSSNLDCSLPFPIILSLFSSPLFYFISSVLSNHGATLIYFYFSCGFSFLVRSPLIFCHGPTFLSLFLMWLIYIKSSEYILALPFNCFLFSYFSHFLFRVPFSFSVFYFFRYLVSWILFASVFCQVLFFSCFIFSRNYVSRRFNLSGFLRFPFFPCFIFPVI